MSNISILDIEDLNETRLKPLVTKAIRHRAPDPAFPGTMGHNPDMSRSMYLSWGTVFNTGRIDHKLKEVIRVQLSRMENYNY